MFDSIVNVNDYLSEHWLAEVFPTKIKDLAATWKELAAKGKQTPVRGLATLNGGYLADLAALPEPTHQDFPALVTQAHQRLLRAVGFDAQPTTLETAQAETPISVPLLGRFSSLTSTDALHILQAAPVDSVDALLGDDAELLDPVTLAVTSEKTDELVSVPKAITQLFISDHPPRYMMVVAGGAVLVTDAARWSEGRYLAFDVATALDRRDDKAAGELAFHASLWSADVLLPNDDGNTTLDTFTADSEKHAVGVSEDLREGLRISIEKIANEVLAQRRRSGVPVEGIPELPRDLTTQSLRFLYRILFLLFAEARPELGILPVGAPEYSSGYGLDRLREIIQVPLTGPSADGHHLHDSLNLLFRLVNDGHNADGKNSDGLVFEALRSDLFDKKRTPLIDESRLSNRLLQEVLTLLLLSKPSKNKNKQRGYISYAQLGINQLGAVYEGLMSYSGLIAGDDMVEVAKDGDADKGSWLVPSVKSADYDEKDLVWREDRLTGRKDIVRHPKGSFVFRLNGRDRQRSASYYTPEVLTKCVVKYALAELITDDTKAQEILEYRICEPALGSGAFLNEAINQLAAEYLIRRQDELGQRIDRDSYPAELQKVKAYIALHRAYGVDLNSTAVELAEVSLWLNVMHRGLQAPWFGLHLRRGNSLVGARRATYDFGALGRAKKDWLDVSPIDRPLSQGSIGPGEIHHFLLPAHGWGAVADAKQAKEMVQEDASLLKKWRDEVFKKPSAKQLERFRALSRRVERLWELTLRRLEISEREIARGIDVWAADLEPVPNAVSREEVESALFDPESPYMRLRLAMDAWCSLWFWPLGHLASPTARPAVDPPSVDDWIETLEGLLGAAGLKAGDQDQGMLYEAVERFDQIAEIDDLERQFSAMKPVWKLLAEKPWLGTARDIAEEQGFLHWELDFAHVFQRGGFDLQVGNPPWVRPDWWESAVLADSDPYFELREKIPDKVFQSRRADVLRESSATSRYLADLAAWAGGAAYLGSKLEYPLLSGVRTNLYMNFMERVWRSAGSSGFAALLHPEGHFGDPKAGIIRSEAYKHLRSYFNFIEANRWFEGVDSPTQTFGIHVYGPRQEHVNFLVVTNLQAISTLEESLDHDGSGEIPSSSFPNGERDLRPHSSRVVTVNSGVLDNFAKLFDPDIAEANTGRLVRPLTAEHLEIIDLIASNPVRLSNFPLHSSSLWNETTAKNQGFITWRTEYPPSFDDVILQGPHFTVATPFAKEPNEFCKSKNDYTDWDLEELSEEAIPRTNYQRACSHDKYVAALPQWDGRLATTYWRTAWRMMTQPGPERSLHAAVLGPGAAHVNGVTSLAVGAGSGDGSQLLVGHEIQQMRNTVIFSGLMSSLPFDYLVKISGRTNIHTDLVKRFPAPLFHQGSNLMLLRTLLLNCLTRQYADLWNKLYDNAFEADSWTQPFRDFLEPMSRDNPVWTPEIPLRTEFARRAALVEIDALSAIMLGLDADHLALIFRAQFPVLRKYENEMYFDIRGRKIAKELHARGVRQEKADFGLLQAYLRGEDSGDLLDRYSPFPADDLHDQPWFYKPDREAEMRAAHGEFTARLGLM